MSPPHQFPHHPPPPLSQSHQSLQAEMPADVNKWGEAPLSKSPSVCVVQIEFHKCNQRGSVMKDPERPVYYFRQQAEGKHCCHRIQRDVRCIEQFACCAPSLLIFWEEEVPNGVANGGTSDVHRMIICSGLVFKNPKSSFGTQPATADQNRKSPKHLRKAGGFRTPLQPITKAGPQISHWQAHANSAQCCLFCWNRGFWRTGEPLISC